MTRALEPFTALDLNAPIDEPFPGGTHWRLDRPRLVLVHVAARYEVDLERAGDAAAAPDWIAQLADKTWITDQALGELVRCMDWCLGFQAHLCGDAMANDRMEPRVRAQLDRIQKGGRP